MPDPRPIRATAFEQQCSLVDATSWVPVAFISAFVVILVAVGLSSVPGLTVLAMMVLGLSALSRWSQSDARPKVHQSVLVRADEQGVSLDGALVVPRARITAGSVVPADDGAFHVRLEQRPRFAITLGVANAAAGRALLQSLGLDAAQTAASFAALPPEERIDRRPVYLDHALPVVAGMVVPFLALVALAALDKLSMPAFAGVGLGSSLLVLLAYRITGARLTVGADGILRRGAGRKEFIPYAEIDAVRFCVQPSSGSAQQAQGVEIRLRSAERIQWMMLFASTDEPRMETLRALERIREAMESYQRRSAAASVALLERRGRPVAAWINAARGLGSGANADHRTAPLPADVLWSVVEDPSAPSDSRVGAAVALRAGLDEAGMRELRIAVDATAEPRLRIALDAALAEDEAALAEALDGLSEARPSPPRAAR